MATTANGSVSLERALSKLGLTSRAQARTLITQGRVRVNGAIVTNPSARVVPERLAIEIDGTARERAQEPVTILLHKPRGYVTTRSDPEGRKTVYDLLTDLPDRVVPVGRLDLATSGLLILTNETHFANWLADPASEIPRVYLVTARGEVTDAEATQLTDGVISRGERIAADQVTIRKRSKRETHVVLTLREGKNREIRRLFDAIDHPVTQLRRVQFGGLELGTLASGKWRRVSAGELSAAFPDYVSRRAPRPK